MEATKKKSGGLKEVWRKFLVSLKRRPQMIPLLVFVAAFVFYSMNLMHISDTTARIQGAGMGLAGFATMLFSMLSFMCFLNAFPYRKKPNMPMVALMFVMLVIVIFADAYYIGGIYAAIDSTPVSPIGIICAALGSPAANPISVTENTSYIAVAEYDLEIHIIILVVAIVLTLLLPVYSKWLRKIKTSVEVEDNGSMAAIDISGEA